MTPRIHLPAPLGVFVVDARTFETRPSRRKPSGCPTCGKHVGESVSFTTADAAKRWQYCWPELVEMFLEDFKAAGYITKVAYDRWQVTRRGYDLAYVIARLDVQPTRGRRRRWCSDRCRKATERALLCPEIQPYPEGHLDPERARRLLPVTAFADFRELDRWLEERGR